MANADAAYGFRLVEGADSRYNLRRCHIPAADTTATFIGDAVKMHGTSLNGTPSVIQCAAGDPVYGVIVSFEADPATSLEDQYRKASTLRYCQVAMADSGVFQIQDNGTIDITSAGLNANFIVGTGSTVTGLSAMEINSATEATTSTLDLQLIAPVARADNDPAAANADWLVSFNDPQQKPLRTGV
jgi:hypothetical protein